MQHQTRWAPQLAAHVAWHTIRMNDRSWRAAYVPPLKVAIVGPPVWVHVSASLPCLCLPDCLPASLSAVVGRCVLLPGSCGGYQRDCWLPGAAVWGGGHCHLCHSFHAGSSGAAAVGRWRDRGAAEARHLRQRLGSGPAASRLIDLSAWASFLTAVVSKSSCCNTVPGAIPFMPPAPVSWPTQPQSNTASGWMDGWIGWAEACSVLHQYSRERRQEVGAPSMAMLLRGGKSKGA